MILWWKKKDGESEKTAGNEKTAGVGDAQKVESGEAEKIEAPASAVSWTEKLTTGLKRTTQQMAGNITALFTQKKLDQATLDDLMDILLAADLGVETAERLIKALAKDRFDKEVSEREVREHIAETIEEILAPHAKPLLVDQNKKPYVMVMVGVNGAGKTTTMAKLAAQYQAQGLSVMMAAGDTFRAAAVEQLKAWGERLKIPVYAKELEADAAALAYEAYQKAKEDKIDVLLIDTAGRLQNKANLMAELEKVMRVLKKHGADLPHQALLILDGTTGQNAHQQVDIFKNVAGVTGLVITKLDGTAKGGVVVSLAERFALPLYAIGMGEGRDDLQSFSAREFARTLMGLA
jgi:fused signal recognition particle receptor